MAESKNSVLGKMTRGKFVKTTGIGMTGVGAAAMGLGGTASAAPSSSAAFDGPAQGRSPISIVKMDSSLTYDGKYNKETESWEHEGWPELVQRYILSRETDTQAWDLIVNMVDTLYDSMKEMLGAYFEEDSGRYDALSQLAGTNKKVVLKPNFVLATDDTAQAFLEEIKEWLRSQDPPLDEEEPDLNELRSILSDIENQKNAPCGRGIEWGGSTAAPFLAALMRYLCEDIGLSPDQILISEGGDQNEFYWKLYNYTGFQISVPAFYEGKVVDGSGSPVWYGGIGIYWARRYLVQKGFTSAMDGYVNSLVVDTNPDDPKYVPPKEAKGITCYNLNYLGKEEKRCGKLLIPPGANRPWNEGVNDSRVYRIIYTHESLTDDSVAFLFNLPKLKAHGFGNITNAVKNLGIGIPAVWKKGVDGGGTQGWEYSAPNNHGNHDTNVACEKFGIPHDIYYGPIVNGLPKLLPPADKMPKDYPWPDACTYYSPGGPIPDYFGYYDVQKTCGLGGFMMDANLAAQERFGSNILHIVDGVVAANINNEAGAGLTVSTSNEGVVAMAADPIALDKCMLRFMYKRFSTYELGLPPQQPGAFLQAAFLCETGAQKQVPGQLYQPPARGVGMPNGVDSTPSEQCDNRTPWGVAAGLGHADYYAVGKYLDSPLGSINGHLMAGQEEVLSNPPLEHGLIYWTYLVGMSMFQTTKAYMQAYDELCSQAIGFPLICTNLHGVYPGCDSNVSMLLKSDLVDSTGAFVPDGILSFDDIAPDASNRGFVGARVNVPRDIFLRQLQKGDDYEVAYLKTAFYTLTVANRHCDPFWNDDGPGGIGHYYIGASYGNAIGYVTWFMAMAPGPDPVNMPYVAYADWYFYGMSQGITKQIDEAVCAGDPTEAACRPLNCVKDAEGKWSCPGRPHLLIYGTYSEEVTHVMDPDGNLVQLPQPLPPGTYWPSPNFGGYLWILSEVYGLNAFSGDFTGSAYQAAKDYAGLKGYSLRFYVPDMIYQGLEGTVPLGDANPNYRKLCFKAEFYDSENRLAETWPDSYRTTRQSR